MRLPIFAVANENALCYKAGQQKQIKKQKIIFKKMIVVPIKEGENIEKALKKFKRKFEKTGVVKELRRRQCYDKPSVTNRIAKMHAIYVQHLQENEE